MQFGSLFCFGMNLEVILLRLTKIIYQNLSLHKWVIMFQNI